MKKRFKEEQIVKILQEAERADTHREVIREYNISKQTFYKFNDRAQVDQLNKILKKQISYTINYNTQFYGNIDRPSFLR